MSDWREDNFLERLANGLPAGAEKKLCAEAEILCASADSAGTRTISGELRQHLERCPACSDLHRRLALFDQSSSLDLDSQAMEAERRLDSWMKGFLASRSLNSEAPPFVLAPRVLSYPSIPKRLRFWNMQWALAAAAVIFVALGVVYIRRSIIATAPTTEMARATSSQPLPTPANPVRLPEPVSAGQGTPQAIAPTKSEGPKPTKVASSAKTGPTPSSRPELASAPEQTPQIIAQTAPLSAAERPVTAADSSGSTWSTPVHPSIPPARASLSPRGLATTKQGAPGVASPSGAKLAGPPSIRLDAGTRVWISFETTTDQVNGHFQFTGKLLLPVSNSNVPQLKKGTPVTGSGTVSGEQTSLQVVEFELHGVRYRLRMDPRAGALPAGSGKVVEFQNGKVAELWLDSSATYDVIAVQSAQPQRHINAAPPALEKPNPH